MSTHQRLELAPGCIWWPGYLDRPAQEELLAAVEGALAEAPLFTPRMPRTGQPFSVRMSNFGPLGWVSDEAGYRYQSFHPDTRSPWPPMPALLAAAWNDLADPAAPAEAALINWYAPDAKMGLHQDRDEQDLTAPVLSLSLGDTALFRLGGTDRRSPSKSIRLASGDALLLSGPSRLAFHGVDRILPGTSTLINRHGRYNITMRRVSPP